MSFTKIKNNSGPKILVVYHSTPVPIMNYAPPNKPSAVYHEAMIQSILICDHQFRVLAAWLTNACAALFGKVLQSRGISHPRSPSD